MVFTSHKKRRLGSITSTTEIRLLLTEIYKDQGASGWNSELVVSPFSAIISARQVQSYNALT